MEGSSSRSVPDWVMESVKRSMGHLELVAAELPQFLALWKELLAQMPPIQRAQSLLLLSNLTTTLFTLRLRCSGVYDDDHRVNTELDRLKLYQEKLQRRIDMSKGEGRKMKYLERNVQKKRKFQSHNAKSVQSAAKEFLEKAARDLLGDDNGSIKGLLKAGFSDKDNPKLD